MLDNDPEPRRARGAVLVPGLLAAVALASVLATLGDPGLTVDEPINAGHGVRFVQQLARDPGSLVRREGVERAWRSAHDHPPLARILIGLVQAAWDPDWKTAISPTGHFGRPASALAFAAIVGLGARWAWILAGPLGGAFAGVALLSMPRLFAHAHFASPEMISAAFFLAGLESAAWALRTGEGSSGWLKTALAGIVLGLALLTKLTCVLLPVGVAAATALRGRGFARLALWLAVGGGIFFLGWPWLWPLDQAGDSPGWTGSIERFRDFAATGLDRATIYVWYFGRQYPHESQGVPWHYSLVFFVLTIPLPVLWVGGVGAASAIRQGPQDFDRTALWLTLALILVVFSLPIDRYDGERLFLMAFPIGGVLSGLGAAAIGEWASTRIGRWGAAAILAALLVPGIVAAVRMHPFQLSYYNLLAGGLRGADRRGLEATYWGDAITDEVLDAFSKLAPPGACAALLPTLYGGHAVLLSTPRMREKRQFVVPGDRLAESGCQWAILFNRAGYLHDPLPEAVLRDGDVRFELAREGVWLARVVRLPEGFTVPAPAPSPGRTAN